MQKIINQDNRAIKRLDCLRLIVKCRIMLHLRNIEMAQIAVKIFFRVQRLCYCIRHHHIRQRLSKRHRHVRTALPVFRRFHWHAVELSNLSDNLVVHRTGIKGKHQLSVINPRQHPKHFVVRLFKSMQYLRIFVQRILNYSFNVTEHHNRRAHVYRINRRLAASFCNIDKALPAQRLNNPWIISCFVSRMIYHICKVSRQKLR